ncbi:hypothetical protein GB937_009136 [Aspergillus fischeri]|nr:hypothetical protein GB937_009136 [Aspergillus fischeri]
MVIVATSALGMGVDIPNIHSIIHISTPRTLLDYVWMGCAGTMDGGGIGGWLGMSCGVCGGSGMGWVLLGGVRLVFRWGGEWPRGSRHSIIRGRNRGGERTIERIIKIIIEGIVEGASREALREASISLLPSAESFSSRAIPMGIWHAQQAQSHHWAAIDI